MKKLMIMAVSLLAMAFILVADSDVQTVQVVTTSGNTSGAFQASGWLDRIELSGTLLRTSTVTVASYDENDVAIETYVDGVTLTTPAVIRTRAIGMGNDGAALVAAAITGTGGTTNFAGTVLVAPYERILIGGNVKAVCVPSGTPTTTNDVTVRLFFAPLKK